MSEELIQKFFRKECTAEEASEVIEFLKNNPKILNEYLSEKEWDEIESDVSIPGEFWDEVWNEIQKKKKINTTVIWIKRSVVAAGIAGVIVLGFFKMEEKKASLQLSALPAKKNIAPAVQTKTVINTFAIKEQVVLPDSSAVELSKGAMIKYTVPFIHNKRDVQLEGEAYFKVTKDKTKPFTVYAGGLATTALGTEFRITANGSGKVLVQLFEGKVVIRPVNNNMKKWNEEVYLSAGEQLKYDSVKTLVAVEKIKGLNTDLLATQHKTQKNHSDAVTNELVFNSSALPYVMEQLSKYFNARINYNKTEINEMNFTGTISKNDSLSVILKVIAQMNDLQISSTDSGFLIEKINKQ
jgi:hypothetical protein